MGLEMLALPRFTSHHNRMLVIRSCCTLSLHTKTVYAVVVKQTHTLYPGVPSKIIVFLFIIELITLLQNHLCMLVRLLIKTMREKKIFCFLNLLFCSHKKDIFSTTYYFVPAIYDISNLTYHQPPYVTDPFDQNFNQKIF